jgi:hypothetical protein
MTMRTLGICASILATAQLLIVSSPAFAQDAPSSSATDTKSSTATDTKSPDNTPPGDTKPAPSTDGTVEVHIDSPQTVSLERREGATWQHVCVSPCDQRLSVSGEYRILGTDLNESKAFMLDSTKGKVVLYVAPGYHNTAQQGLWIAVGSGAVLVGGILTILLGSDGKTPFNADGQTHLGNTNAIFAGSVLILAGVCGGILGSAWLYDNSHTRVGGDVAKAPPASEPAPPGGPVETKFQFQTSKREPSGLPAVMSVPILSRSF